MMTGRERLIAALNRREVDRLPWSLCMDGFYTTSLPEQGYRMDLLETLRYFKNDVMIRHVPIFKLIQKGIDVRVVEKNGLRTTTYDTPVGSIHEIHKATGHTWYLQKPKLENIEDVKVYQWMLEHSDYEPDYETFLAEDRRIGDDGLATPSGPLTPIQQLLQHDMRIETTVYSLEDDQEIMEELFDTIHNLNLKAYRIIAESPAEVSFTYEDTSTTVMSRSMYQDYCARQLDEYTNILHSGSKVSIVHMCGKLKGFANEVGAGNMDGIDSLCPPTTGDFWAHDARACWGENKIIIGGLEPPYMQRAGEEEMIRYAVNVINKMAPGKNFILSSGDAVSYGTPVVNLCRVTDLVQKYGAFPLTGQIDPDEAVRELCGKPCY